VEVLLHSGTKIGAWRSAEIHEAALTAFGMRPENYSFTQLRYDLRKLRAHALLERDGQRYAYRLTQKGNKAAFLFVLFHKRVCGHLANSPFNRPPSLPLHPHQARDRSRRADLSIERLLQIKMRKRQSVLFRFAAR
jgi:hypothetical protein